METQAIPIDPAQLSPAQPSPARANTNEQTTVLVVFCPASSSLISPPPPTLFSSLPSSTREVGLHSCVLLRVDPRFRLPVSAIGPWGRTIFSYSIGQSFFLLLPSPLFFPLSSSCLFNCPLSQQKRRDFMVTDRNSSWQPPYLTSHHPRRVNINTMVSRAYYPPPHSHPHHDGMRAYLPTRSCGPYMSYPGSERRYQLASHDTRAITMDPQQDETTPPRKRIAVAVSCIKAPPPTHLGENNA